MIRFAHRIVIAALIFATGSFYCVSVGAQTAPYQVAANDVPEKSKSGKSKSAKNKSKEKNATSKSSKEKKAESKSKKKTAKKGGKSETSNDEESDSGKPVQIASYHDWGAFLAQGKDKTCYVLAQPTERQPSKLKRDPAYVFISSRPGENIHNEVSITMGFLMKDGAEAEADVAGSSFDLVSKGKNAWVKNPAEEAQFIAAMRKSAKLVIKATSIKGNVTTDSYSLAGLSQALDRVEKECE